MSRRRLEIGLPLLAIAILAVILYNATLVDRRPPSVASVLLSATAGDPKVGQTLTAIDVEFSEAVKTGTVERRFTIAPYVAGTFRWDGQTTLIFTPSQRLPAETVFTVSIAAGFEDLTGNAATAATDPFVFRTVGRPIVLSATPEGADVPIDATVSLTFDRLMATGAVEQALSITPAVPYRASWSQRVLTLTFSQPLGFGTTYTLDLRTDASDTDGAHLAAPYSLTFTTVAAGLSVLSTAPADGIAGINVGSSIALAFDAPIDPASVADALEITPPVGGEATVVSSPQDEPTSAPSASASPTPAPKGRMLVFTPNAPLAAHTTYTVTLRPVVRREGSSGEVAAGRTWTFTTGQPAASAQNQVLFLTARSGVRNVWMMNPDGTNPRQLTTSIAPVSAYDVTVDGTTLATSAAGVVRVQRIDGAEQRLVTGAGQYDYAPSFTADGRSLIVGRRSSDGVDLGYWLLPVPSTGSGEPRQLTTTGAPPIRSVAMTGDGISTGDGASSWASRLAFDAAGATVLIVGADGSPWLVDLAHPEAQPTPVGLKASSAPVWSVGGNEFLLAATTADSPVPGIWSVRRGGTINRVVTGIGPVAADRERAIALLQDANNGAIDPLHVAYLPRPVATPLLLTTAADLSDRTPVFSPNGQEILFVRVSTLSPDQSAGIWLVGLDGRELRQLTRDGAYPRWLP